MSPNSFLKGFKPEFSISEIFVIDQRFELYVNMYFYSAARVQVEKRLHWYPPPKWLHSAVAIALRSPQCWLYT